MSPIIPGSARVPGWSNRRGVEEAPTKGVIVKLFHAPTEFNPHPKGVQRVYHFPNGYGASLIPDRGRWELAVLDGARGWALTYDTEITGDVVPGLTDEEAETYLVRIAGLLRAIEAPTERPAPIDGEGLMNALIAFYADRSEFSRVTSGDLLIHAVSVVKGLDEDRATEYVSEDLADRRAAMG